MNSPPVMVMPMMVSMMMPAMVMVMVMVISLNGRFCCHAKGHSHSQPSYSRPLWSRIFLMFKTCQDTCNKKTCLNSQLQNTDYCELSFRQNYGIVNTHIFPNHNFLLNNYWRRCLLYNHSRRPLLNYYCRWSLLNHHSSRRLLLKYPKHYWL